RISPHTLAVVVAMAAVLAFVSIKVWYDQQREHRLECVGHLQQLGLALLNYESLHKEFPPIYSTDKDGKPLQSWRALALPFLEVPDGVFNRWHLNEPWDSPNNTQFASIGRHLYRCPSDSRADPLDTNYVAIVGKGTAWQPGRALTSKDIKDNPHDTILVVEMKNPGIRWAEPRDLNLNDLPPGVTKETL